MGTIVGTINLLFLDHRTRERYNTMLYLRAKEKERSPCTGFRMKTPGPVVHVRWRGRARHTCVYIHACARYAIPERSFS